MISKEERGLVLVRFFPGEDFLQGLQTACAQHNPRTAVVVGAVGMLRQVELRYFKGTGDYSSTVFAEPMELVALSGLISREGTGYHSHLHAGFARQDKTMVGGHLQAGLVAVTAEVALLKSEIKTYRIKEKESGLLGLFFEERSSE